MQLQYLFVRMKLIKKHANRISKNLLKCCERLNTDNIEFPPKIKDIEQFEKDNVIFQLQYLNIMDFER